MVPPMVHGQSHDRPTNEKFVRNMVSGLLQNSTTCMFIFNNLNLFLTRSFCFQQFNFSSNNVYFHLISTLANFILWQYSFNFNTRNFHSTAEYSFNFNNHYFYSTATIRSTSTPAIFVQKRNVHSFNKYIYNAN